MISLKLIHCNGKSVRNHGSSRFPKVFWGIWVSISSLPPPRKVCAGRARGIAMFEILNAETFEFHGYGEAFKEVLQLLVIQAPTT